MTQAEHDGRICSLKINRDLPVHTAWDIGIDDPAAIWCFQIEPGRVNVVDYYESSGHGLGHYCDWLDERGYHGIDWVPHDARVREFSSGRTRLEHMQGHGRHPRVAPSHRLMDGIQAGRLTIPVAYFDIQRCAKGIECLRQYQAEWDENLRTFKRTPLHNWASHGADAWRQLGVSWREPMEDMELSFEEKTKIARDELDAAIAEMSRPRTLNELIAEYEDQVELEDA
jgi:phage terminase large subunit